MTKSHPNGSGITRSPGLAFKRLSGSIIDFQILLKEFGTDCLGLVHREVRSMKILKACLGSYTIGCVFSLYFLYVVLFTFSLCCVIHIFS